jgi:biopolymer transport protein ExbD
MVVIEGRKRTSRGIDMTPLIDIVFQLLLFFMLTTSFVRVESLNVNLAGPSVSTKPVTNPVATIDLEATGATLINGKPVWEHELQDKLNVLFTRASSTQVLIRAEDAVEVQRLIDMMDAVTVAGGKQMAVEKLRRPSPMQNFSSGLKDSLQAMP